MTNQLIPQGTTTKERLAALLQIVLDKSSLNKAFLPTIRGLALSYLKDIPDLELEQSIRELRDTYIPWILNEAKTDEARHENTITQ